MIAHDDRGNTVDMMRRDFRRSYARYCCYCGVLLCHEHRQAGEPPCGDEATWDHIVVHQNGKSVLGRDKVVACRDCNTDRGDKTIPGWHQSLGHRLEAGRISPEYLRKAWRVFGVDEAVIPPSFPPKR